MVLFGDQCLMLFCKDCIRLATALDVLTQVSRLTVDYYRDLTEERGLTLHCGYPLCNNQLKSVSNNHTIDFQLSGLALVCPFLLQIMILCYSPRTI